MRTTVKIDPDVEELLRKVMQQESLSFEQALNEAVRRGLRGKKTPAEIRFRVEARPLQLRREIDAAAFLYLDSELEIEEFHRKTRVLERSQR